MNSESKCWLELILGFKFRGKYILKYEVFKCFWNYEEPVWVIWKHRGTNLREKTKIDISSCLLDCRRDYPRNYGKSLSKMMITEREKILENVLLQGALQCMVKKHVCVLHSLLSKSVTDFSGEFWHDKEWRIKWSVSSLKQYELLVFLDCCIFNNISVQK